MLGAIGDAGKKFWAAHGNDIIQAGLILATDGLSLEEGGGGRLEPHPAAEGPHTSFKVDGGSGAVSKYEQYRPQSNPRNPNPWESVQRFDRNGPSHYNKATKEYVPTPHMHDPQTPGVRPATPQEIPRP